MEVKNNQGVFYGIENNTEPMFDEFKKEKYNHNLVLGSTGKGTKVITFKEENFKKELAPKNANIEYIEANGKKMVKMTYQI